MMVLVLFRVLLTKGLSLSISRTFRNKFLIFILRKAFEVCGNLENMYVAKKRNVNGNMYDFVRFSKVRDITKLLYGLNGVCFGQFHIWMKSGKA